MKKVYSLLPPTIILSSLTFSSFACSFSISIWRFSSSFLFLSSSLRCFSTSRFSRRSFFSSSSRSRFSWRSFISCSRLRWRSLKNTNAPEGYHQKSQKIIVKVRYSSYHPTGISENHDNICESPLILSLLLYICLSYLTTSVEKICS